MAFGAYREVFSNANSNKEIKFNSPGSGLLQGRTDSGCDNLTPMRRAQAILVIIALLATPLALLARAASAGTADCNRMCCLPHGSHSAHIHDPIKSSAAQGAFCPHGAAQQDCSCVMRAGDHHIDYGFLAPIVPTAPSAIVSVAIPEVSRGISLPRAEIPATGFLSAPFEPPRA
jgi:hypothetical protein